MFIGGSRGAFLAPSATLYISLNLPNNDSNFLAPGFDIPFLPELWICSTSASSTTWLSFTLVGWSRNWPSTMWSSSKSPWATRIALVGFHESVFRIILDSFPPFSPEFPTTEQSLFCKSTLTFYR